MNLKKKIIYSSIALLFFAFSPVSSQIKVGFVDSDVIIGQLPEAQAIKKKIEVFN